MGDPESELILMLEDDRDRIERFAAVIAQQMPELTLFQWRSAHEFIAAHKQLQVQPRLIALDHDLFVEHPADPDPGDGRDVARFLAAIMPQCPILIHSSNSIAADSMLYTLRDSGWIVDRIAPLGDDWIEAYWLPTATRMLRSE